MKEGPLASQEFELDQPRVLLGRDPLADIRITDDIISRKHACISRQDDHYFLEDLGSANGTYLNEQLVVELYSK